MILKTIRTAQEQQTFLDRIGRLMHSERGPQSPGKGNGLFADSGNGHMGACVCLYFTIKLKQMRERKKEFITENICVFFKCYCMPTNLVRFP